MATMRNKVKIPNSRPGAPTPKKDIAVQSTCTRCGVEYKRQNGNFAIVKSPMYSGNRDYMHVCNLCIDELYEHYRDCLGSDKAAVKRMCLKFDVYWSESIYDRSVFNGGRNTRFRQYIMKSYMASDGAGKTYDDTLDEEERIAIMEEERKQAVPEPAVEVVQEPIVPETTASVEPENECVEEKVEIPFELISFWGAGLPDDMYGALDIRWHKWTDTIEGELDIPLEAKYKQICILEETVNRNILDGKSLENTVKTLNDLIKDVQKSKDDATDEAFDNLPFGLGIRMCENARPIPKPIPELEDVDGVIRYITIWFLGHLCKMLGIKNTYCKLYEEEMALRRVDRVELEDEDDEGAFNEIFGDSGSGDGG